MVLKKFIILPSIILTSLKNFICYQVVCFIWRQSFGFPDCSAIAFMFSEFFKNSLPKLINPFVNFE